MSKQPSNLNKLTVLRAQPSKDKSVPNMNKTFTSTETKSYDKAYMFKHEEKVFQNIEQLHELLTTLEEETSACIVRAKPKTNNQMAPRQLDTMEEVQRCWVMLDFDEIAIPDELSSNMFDGRIMAEHLVQKHLPKQFHDASYHWQFSNSYGVKKDKIRMHLWFIVSKPMGYRDWGRYFEHHASPIDFSVFRTVQVHYTANPIFDGINDPVPVRSGLVKKRPFATIHKIEPPLMVTHDNNHSMTLNEAKRLHEITTDPLVKMRTKVFIDGLEKRNGSLVEAIIAVNQNQLHHSDLNKLMAGLINQGTDSFEVMRVCNACKAPASNSNLTGLYNDIIRAGAKCGYSTLKRFAGGAK